VPENNDSEIVALAGEINRYLDKHPDAADSLEGIIKWWLLRERYELTRDRVEKAIERLVEDGEIEQSILTGGRVIYMKAKGSDKGGSGE